MVDIIRDSLAGKVAVVLGAGAGQGISTVRMFINFGAKVAMVSRSGNTYGLVESSTVKAFKADLTNEAQVKEVRDKILQAFGQIDCVVSNVGKWESSKDPFPSKDFFDSMINTNLYSHVSIIKYFSEPMKKNGGSIVLIGASPGIFHGNDLSYNLSKAAVTELARKSAESLRKYNIRVNAVLPGSVNKEDTYFKVFPFNVTKFSQSTTLEPIETAMVNVFLASEMSIGINGQAIPVDRGLNAVQK
ncbi:MAG TPA: SDR family oxidoreductase [Thermoplasmataceae archaeon]|nr:SDR family oxidoreductase [Thermoplasmatales archaeon AK]HLH85547.1 SDR family oxidoreductase [Thermoplasmataceae archaeon]